MPTVTLSEPPEAFSCQLCARPEWRAKAGAGCNGCPAFNGTHFHPDDRGPEGADIIVVGDAPAPPPRLVLIGGKGAGLPKTRHETFDDAAGRVLRTAVDRVLSRREFGALQVLYTYAVKCAVENPNKKIILTCADNLRRLVHRTAQRRQAAGRQNKIVVIACGVAALVALGVSVRSEDEALNRIFEDVDVAGVKVNVVFTRSLKAHGTQDGKFNTLLADIERAARLATSSLIRVKSREEIEKGFVYPKTLEEIRKLVDHVIGYSEFDIPPMSWKISFDTETNTLHPNWDGTKLLSVSFAWATSKAASVALWHPRNDMYDPAAAYEEIKRLLTSGKPIIWFNGKYDYKVFWRLGWPQGDVGNVAWDALLAEHVLEEDKKKFYSLKMLTKQFLPELAGYEDRLQGMLEEANERVDAAQPSTEGKTLRLPPAVAAALDTLLKKKVLKTQRFQVKTLETAVKDPKWAEIKDQIQLVLNAKKSGEFQTKADKAPSKKKKTGGFESIPLQELMFYACVDADATRRIAVIQVQRMHEEDFALSQLRNKIEEAVKLGRRDPFTVQRLCPTPSPLRKLVQDDYLPRQRELAKIEYNGMRVDLNYCTWGAESLGQTVEHTRQQIFELAGGDEFKLGSTKRLGQLFFGDGYIHPDPEAADKLAAEYPGLVNFDGKRISYKAQAYTAKGAIQVSDGVMKSLVARYKCPLANLLLAHKKADKGKNTFFANIEALATYFGDGKLHAGYGLTSTSTGRLSSAVQVGDARFNAQNIPKGLIGALRDLKGALVLSDEGRPVFEGVNCKKLFVPDDDSYCFGNADAKGAEVSIYSAYSKDQALIAALQDGLDAHCFFGSECLNPKLVAAGLSGESRRIALVNAGIDDDHEWSYEDFLKGKDGLLPDKAYGKRLKALRDNIKRLVFGMLYGAGIKKIAEIAGISHEFAKKIQELLFTKFPTIRTFMDRTKWELRTFGMVEAFNGRRRRFLIGAGAPNELRAQAERRAINFKVQGTNSDIVLSVLCWLAPVIENDLRGRLLLTVHDSIGFQVPKKYAHQVRDIFTQYGTNRVAEAFPWMPVPYRWDVELGPSYGEVMDFEKYVKALPAPTPEPQFDGYTEEEQFDDLRDPDGFEMPERTRAP
jgi:DNA polymerase I-like protein with 3'-5' exonuclease and polymerase domains